MLSALKYCEKKMRRVLIILFFLVSTAEAEKPTSQEFLALLIRSADLPLSKDNLGCSHDTLGSYLSFLLATAAEKEKRQLLSTAIVCRPMKVLGHWRCSYYVNIRDADSGDPWNYGIEAIFKKGQEVLEPHQVSCPGSA